MIAAYVDILFVPFGKADSTNGEEPFTCQHGPNECAGNKVQSCSLVRIADQTQQVEFANCFMTDANSRRGNGETVSCLLTKF